MQTYVTSIDKVQWDGLIRQKNIEDSLSKQIYEVRVNGLSVKER